MSGQAKSRTGLQSNLGNTSPPLVLPAGFVLETPFCEVQAATQREKMIPNRWLGEVRENDSIHFDQCPGIQIHFCFPRRHCQWPRTQ